MWFKMKTQADLAFNDKTRLLFAERTARCVVFPLEYSNILRYEILPAQATSDTRNTALNMGHGFPHQPPMLAISILHPHLSQVRWHQKAYLLSEYCKVSTNQ